MTDKQRELEIEINRIEKEWWENTDRKIPYKLYLAQAILSYLEKEGYVKKSEIEADGAALLKLIKEENGCIDLKCLTCEALKDTISQNIQGLIKEK